MSKIISFVTFGLFFVALISGFIILFAYHPSHAFESVQKISYLIPFGLFFRKLHYFSSEAFMIFLLLHVMIELSKKKINIDSFSWNYSVIGVVLVIVLMFSGFVLKGDLSANAAAQVAFNLIKDTPIIKTFLPLIKDSTVFYYKFFIWHILFLPLFLAYAIYKHIKFFQIKALYLSIAIGISVFAMMIFGMPKDIVLSAKVKNLESPWFFTGAENLLSNSFSPLFINIILFIPFVLLVLYYYTKQKNLVRILLIFWLLAYSYISVFSL